MAHNPDVLSGMLDDSTTPITPARWVYAAERNNTSTLGQERFPFGPCGTRTLFTPSSR